MAATWAIDSFAFANRGRRTVNVTATRTDGIESRTYRVSGFNVRPGIPLATELDRLRGEFTKQADADASWGVPTLDNLFPGAATALKTALDAMES